MRVLFITLAFVFTAVVSTASAISWRVVTNRYFSFSLPLTFTKTDARGVDSFAEEYVADGIKVSFDYGEYSDDFGSWSRDTKYEEVVVDGKPGKIGTVSNEDSKDFPYITQIYVKLHGRLALSVSAVCRSKKEVALARTIFLAIKFLREKTGG